MGLFSDPINIKKNAVYGQLLLNEKMYSATLSRSFQRKKRQYEIVIFVRKSASKNASLILTGLKRVTTKTFFENCQFSVSYFFFFQNSFTIPVSLKIGKFFKSRYYTILYKVFYK